MKCLVADHNRMQGKQKLLDGSRDTKKTRSNIPSQKRTANVRCQYHLDELDTYI